MLLQRLLLLSLLLRQRLQRGGQRQTAATPSGCRRQHPVFGLRTMAGNPFSSLFCSFFSFSVLCNRDIQKTGHPAATPAATLLSVRWRSSPITSANQRPQLFSPAENTAKPPATAVLTISLSSPATRSRMAATPVAQSSDDCTDPTDRIL